MGVRRSFQRPVEALTGLVLGGVAGVIVGIGLIAFRAHAQGVYLHDPDEVWGWPVVPVVLLGGLGLVLGFRDRDRLWRWALGALIDLPIGVAGGALLGAVVEPGEVGPWSGAIFGATAGILLGPLLGNRIRASHRLLRDVSHGLAVLGGLAIVVGGVVAWRTAPGPPPGPTVVEDPDPDPSRVAAAVFLLGDAGDLTPGASPLIPALRADMERWSRAMAGDEETVLLVLGDVVYPYGVRDRDDPGFAADSAVVEGQLAALPGRTDSVAEARANVVAGNHDWGQARQRAGARRLQNLDTFLRSRPDTLPSATLVPPAGEGGPGVVDVGDGLRLILLDTAWWLLGAEPEAEERVIAGIRAALADAGGRRTIMAAHHPLHSAGPHGGLARFGETLGLRAVLARSGVLLQDIFSPAYRELREGLVGVFADEGPPDIFAGGHEHSLQAIRLPDPAEPRLNLVVGSGSKLTGVQEVEGMLFGVSEPGWGRILLLRDGTLHVTLHAAPERFLDCAPGSGGDAGEVAECMGEGTGAFRPVWVHEMP